MEGECLGMPEHACPSPLNVIQPASCDFVLRGVWLAVDMGGRGVYTGRLRLLSLGDTSPAIPVPPGSSPPPILCQKWASEGSGPWWKQEMKERWQSRERLRVSTESPGREEILGLIAFSSPGTGTLPLHLLKDQNRRKWTN